MEKMHCTMAEIEAKRRQAQLKLLAKHKNSAPNQLNTTPAESAGSPLKKYNFKPYEKGKPTLHFQGSSAVITATCCLISDCRFSVEITGFSTLAIAVFRTIPSKNYNMNTKIWDFHIKDYDLFQNKMSALQPDVICNKLPNYVLKVCRMLKSDYSNIDLSKIDEKLSSTLMPFQVEGVCFGIEKQGRCLIADEMGLGKTFQALAIASYYKEDFPLLVVTTSSMKNTWEDTIHKFLPSVSIMFVQYMTSAKDYIGSADILIVSYDMMSRSIDKLLERNFGVLIFDESHTLKNFKAKCSKAATSLAKIARRAILLSGTPALSRPSELFSQLSLIDEKFFGNFFDYSRRYCDGKQTNFGWDTSGKSNLPELEIILGKRFMIRRTKDDVLKSLPDKVQEVVTLDVNLDQFTEDDRRCLNALADKYNSGKKGLDKHALLLTFFSETSRIKIPSVCSYILQVLETTQKFLIFAHHLKMLDAIQKVLLKKHIKFIRIDGCTTSEQRKYYVDKFQLDDTYTCALLSITAANAGITLTRAQLIIFAELHWNPSILSQAESRAHRIGQQGQVVVKYLIAPGTADDNIWPMLQDKQKILNEIGLTKDSYENVSVTKQDMMKKEAIAECLNSSVTSYDTLDISTYFKSPEENNRTLNASTNVKSEDMDLFFDDDFDDVLANIDI